LLILWRKIALCSCDQFKRTGALFAHVLKVLDKMNIKLLPDHYILKRWTRDASYGTMQDNKGRSIIENPKLDAMLRYKSLSHKFLHLAYQAANFPECCLLVDDALDSLGKLQEKMPISILCDSYTVQPEVGQDEDSRSVARLKKKEVEQKNSKRHRSWLDKTRKYTKKVPNKSSVCC